MQVKLVLSGGTHKAPIWEYLGSYGSRYAAGRGWGFAGSAQLSWERRLWGADQAAITSVSDVITLSIRHDERSRVVPPGWKTRISSQGRAP
jgi:hypothetical protein